MITFFYEKNKKNFHFFIKNVIIIMSKNRRSVMKLFKYLVFITILVFSLTISVSAESCDSDDIKRLRVLASNVEITYEYNDNLKDSDGFTIYDTYKVIINNMTDELYVIETKTNTNLRNYSIKDGVITVDRMNSGKKSFKIYSKACNKSLKTFYVTLPKFNSYSADPNCEGKEDLEVCQKFYDSSDLEYSEFYNIVTSEEKNDNDNQNIVEDEFNYVEFFKNNYIYFIVIGFVLLVIIVLLVLRHRKRGALE